MAKVINRRFVGDPKVDAALVEIYDALESLQNHPLLNGREVEVTFTGGSGLTQKVIHKLGRKFKGYAVVRASAGVTLLLANTDDTNPAFEFDLTSSAPAVVTLWVY